MAIPWADFFAPPTAISGFDSGAFTDIDEWPPSVTDTANVALSNGEVATFSFTFNLSSATGDKKGFVFWWSVHSQSATGVRIDRIQLSAGSTLLHSETSPSFAPIGTTTITNTSTRTFLYQFPDRIWHSDPSLSSLTVTITVTNLVVGNNNFTTSAVRLSKSPFTTAQEKRLPNALNTPGRRYSHFRESDLYDLGGVDDEEIIVWPDASGRGMHMVRVQTTGTAANLHDDDGEYVDFPEGTNGTLFGFIFGLPIVTGNHIHHARVMFYEGSVGGSETRTIYAHVPASYFVGQGVPGDKNILGLDQGTGDQWVIMSGDGTGPAHLHGGSITLDTWYRATQWVQDSGNEHLWINADVSPVIDGASGSNNMTGFGIGGREDFNSARHHEGRISELWFIDGDSVSEADIDAARDEWTNGHDDLDGIMYPNSDQGSTTVVNELDIATALHLSVGDDPDSPNDLDWINNHNSNTGEAWFDLTETPVNFGTMTGITMELRFKVTGSFATYPGTRELFARIYQSDETTPLTDEETVVSVTATADWANTSPITFSGVSASDKTTWDGARVRLRWA